MAAVGLGEEAKVARGVNGELGEEGLKELPDGGGGVGGAVGDVLVAVAEAGTKCAGRRRAGAW